MGARIIDGKGLAERTKRAIAERAAACAAKGLTPRLDAVIAGTEDTPARVYANRQASTCRRLGIEYELHELAGDCGYEDASGLIRTLNDDPEVHAIMMHLPLPSGCDTERV